MSLDPKRDEASNRTSSSAPLSPLHQRPPALEEILNEVRAAIRAGDLSGAGKLLSPWLEETRRDLEVAMLWLQLLGELNHAGQLARELRRLASCPA